REPGRTRRDSLGPRRRRKARVTRRPAPPGYSFARLAQPLTQAGLGGNPLAGRAGAGYCRGASLPGDPPCAAASACWPSWPRAAATLPWVGAGGSAKVGRPYDNLRVIYLSGGLRLPVMFGTTALGGRTTRGVRRPCPAPACAVRRRGVP